MRGCSSLGWKSIVSRVVSEPDSRGSGSETISRARLSYAGRESGQTPIRLWCCILSSSVLNEVGVNMVGTCSEKAGFR